MAAGIVLTAVASGASWLAAFSSPTPWRIAAAAATLAALILAVRLARRLPGTAQLRVTVEAQIVARDDPASEPRPLQARFAAPWLIVLDDGRSVLPVWPDQLAADEFRRLAVACRWRRPPAPA